MTKKYILKNRKIYPCDDLMLWGAWMEENRSNRHVGDDQIGDIWVSTVFLGLDHSYRNNGVPILFETMLFGGPIDQDMNRYEDIESAESGHESAVSCAKEIIKAKGKSWRRVKKFLPLIVYDHGFDFSCRQKECRHYFGKHLKK